jgi:hypothetical protein
MKRHHNPLPFMTICFTFVTRVPNTLHSQNNNTTSWTSSSSQARQKEKKKQTKIGPESTGRKQLKSIKQIELREKKRSRNKPKTNNTVEIASPALDSRPAPSFTSSVPSILFPDPSCLCLCMCVRPSVRPPLCLCLFSRP